MPASTAEALEDRMAAAVEILGPLARRNVSLAPFTTYKVGGGAAIFVDVSSDDDFDVIAAAVASSGLPMLVVGRGSNLLVSDDGFDGIAVSLSDISSSIRIDELSGLVEAGSSVLLPVLARQTVRADLAGFEWAVGVPGSVGGAIKMNAGGHGSDMSASLQDVEIVDVSTGIAVRSRVQAADLGLRFRGSGVASTSLVLSARLQLRPGADREAGERELSEIVAWRRANQPGGQNAGSVFVNPVPGEVSAGALIDEVGLRGHRLNSAMVSEKHANFIQADEGGSAADVVELMRFVRARVLEATGYAMRSEIRLIGFEQLWD